MLSLIIMLMIIAFLAFFAYKWRALTFSGALTAIVIGITIYIGTGLKGLFLLGTFFITSTFWSKYKHNQKMSSQSISEKGEQRDWAQVFANGGVPALSSFCLYIFDEPVFLFVFIVALAAANADTWASEIGLLSKSDPIHLLTFKKVPSGTSGAISILGTTAGFLGSTLIVIFSAILWWGKWTLEAIGLMIALGFFSMLIDTVLGSTIQRKNKCKVCNLLTEKKVHCGYNTEIYSGWSFINNDGVNLLSILIASFIGLIFYSFSFG